MSDLILVTGATGFIATHTVVRLIERGFRVRGTVRSKEKGESLKKFVSDRTGKDIEIAIADLLEDDGWAEAMKGCDGLFHMASPFPGDVDDEDEVVRPAVEGTERVLKAAIDAGITRAVLTSSVAAVAYGMPPRPDGVFTEDDWTDPDGESTSAYAKSKLLAERKAWEVVDGTGLALTVINPSLVLGPMIEDDHGTSVGMVRQLLSGEMDKIPATGLGVVDVRDVVEAHIEGYVREAAKNERFITSDVFMTMDEIARELVSSYPERAGTITSERAEGDIARRAPSNKKARDVLGIDFVPAKLAIQETARDLIARRLV